MISRQKTAHAITLTLLCFFTWAQSGTVPTIAVLYFQNNSLKDKTSYSALDKGFCDIFITELSRMGGLRVVERERIDELFKEIALGQTGAIDPSSAPQVGKLIGADILTLGSFMVDFSGTIRIDTRLVEVETGKVIKAEEITGDPKRLFKLVKRLSLNIADELSVKLSKDEKQLIEKSDQVSLDALMTYSLALEALAKGDTVAALSAAKKAYSDNKSFERAGTLVKMLSTGK